MYKAVLMGASLDTGNMGVSALAASFAKIVTNIYPNAELYFFIGNRSEKPQNLTIAGRCITIQVLNHRLSPRAKYSEHLFWLLLMAFLFKMVPIKRIRRKITESNWRLKNLINADFIGNICGGDSFSDIYGTRRLLIESIPNLIVLLLGKNIVLLPQTYGPYNAALSKIVAKHILKKASLIMSRDRRGIQVVMNLLPNPAQQKKICLCPDVAFALESTDPNKFEILPHQNGLNDRPIIGININGLLYNGGYTRQNMFNLIFDYRKFIHELSEKILKALPVNLLLIPHTYAPAWDVESDNDACMKVFNAIAEEYHDRIYVIDTFYNQSEIKSIIGKCGFFIGSRMHACIAALSQTIPTIGIAYSRKFAGVFDTIGMGDMVVDARSTPKENAIQKILELYEKRARCDLAEKIQSANGHLMDEFRFVMGAREKGREAIKHFASSEI